MENIKQLAKEHYQADRTINGIYKLLKRIGMVWIGDRSQYPKIDRQIQQYVEVVLPEGITIEITKAIAYLMLAW